jgi:hypothetical protein
MMLEMEIENTTISGDVREVDGSFTHEFGVEKVSHLEVSDLTVSIEIAGNIFDVTTGLNAAQLDFIREKFIAWSDTQITESAC